MTNYKEAEKLVDEVFDKIDQSFLLAVYDYGTLAGWIYDYVNKGIINPQEIFENILLDHVPDEFLGNA